MIDTEQIKQRFKERAFEVDELGRKITVRRLRLSEQCQVNEFTENGLNRTIFLMVASMCEFQRGDDNSPIYFSMPKDRNEVDINLDLLGDEGFDALTKAYRKLHGMAEQKKTDPDGSVDG